MTTPLDHIQDCRKCILRRFSSQVVVGSGALDRKIMVVGEAPGREEDDTGRPFVGKSGQYLIDAFNFYKIRREQLYITNIIKCRPPENRDPQSDEIEACSPHLHLQLKVINPVLIVPVGRFSLQWFIKGIKITQGHGELFKYNGTDLMPLLHPAYILRNRSLENRFYMGVEAIRNHLLVLANQDKPLFENRRTQ